MKKSKVVTVVGARPQFIKTAVLSPHLREKFNEIIIHTGQHYDKEMSDIFFDELSIPKPDYNLGIRSLKQGEQTSKMLVGIERILIKVKPRLVIVHGDTNSTLAGALAAAKLKIPVAHVEAGLRSFNRSMPEEINRVITDHISEVLFCPTKTAALNLKNEGIVKGVYLVGDVMYDSMCCYLPQARSKSEILSNLMLERRRYYLLTIHRASNTLDLEKLNKILSLIDNSDLPVIFPIHPRTKNFLGNSFKPKNALIIISPVSYLDMLVLEENAKAIFTDSGGVQKEAYILKVPCLTFRSETEWVETLKYRCNQIVKHVDIKYFSAILRRLNTINKKCFNLNVYGNGNSVKKIVDILGRFSNCQPPV